MNKMPLSVHVAADVKTRVVFLSLLLLSLCSVATADITFSGYQWVVRNGFGGPGPNTFDGRNVRVDANGYLHLRLSWRVDHWTSSEIFLAQSLGFGSYQFKVVGRPDQFDANTVLGLFHYTVPEIGPDGTNEIDIEFARWGNPANNAGNWTVYPAITGVANKSHSFPLLLTGKNSTHRYTWRSCQIQFQSLRGLQDSTSNNEIAHWTYAPANFTQRIPQHALPLHMNFWLFQGLAPTDGQNREIIISEFKFTPLPADDSVCPT